MAKKTSNKNGLKSNVWWLGVVSLLNDASAEMLTPILPLFMANVLGAGGLTIGLIEGLGKMSERLLSIVFGWYSDKIGKRKPVVAAGYLLAALMKGGFALTTTWTQFLGVRMLERTGKAIRDAPRDALLAQSTDSSSLNDRRAGFALHRTMDTVGGVVGPLIAVALIGLIATDFENTAKTLFLIALVPGLLSVAVILAFVKEPPMRDMKRMKEHKLGNMLNIANYSPGFRNFLASACLFFLAAPALAFFYLKAQSLGFALTNVVILGTVYGIAYIMGARSTSFLSKYVPIKKQQGIMLALLLVALSFFLTSLISSADGFIVPFLLYSVAVGMFEVESKSYISMMVKKEELAGAFGTYQTAIGITMLVAGLLFGFMWDVSQPLAFQVAGTMALASLAVFYFGSRKNKI